MEFDYPKNLFELESRFATNEACQYGIKEDVEVERMSKSALEFAIFCIEAVAQHLNVPGNQVYDMLAKQSDILNTYLIPSFDVLHTQSRQYIVDDILALMQERGVLS